ncbi:hypothetical protein [Verminephrobacter aporrectodeae]|uniref:hypothetical protein n=1 Tax=Verminephrobacter aporrectodeae TaxID=1110389 RepID=UPI002243B8DB|nr:hypothetical protein [Verminephrobacter aporrectodeae]
MAVELYFPHDQLGSKNPDFDLAADYMELTAFFDDQARSFTKDLINASEIGAENDYSDVNEEMINREEIVSGAVKRMEKRRHALGDSWPFVLDENGDMLSFTGQDLSCGQTAYVLSLVLSHLRSVSEILSGSAVYPTEQEIANLRKYFQYFATAALAAEVRGQAWSFGYPRPDGTSFHTKLKQIWNVFNDGVIQTAPGAPNRPKDDQIDIFAARLHCDGLPGFLLAAAQVATGEKWKDKSIRGHPLVFHKRWFSQQPVTDMICYHIIPFARSDDDFRDDCRVLGNVLHRIRVPRRVAEAEELYRQGLAIEAFDQLTAAADWIRAYATRRAVAA